MTISLQASSGWEGRDPTNATTAVFTPTNAAASGNMAVICCSHDAGATVSSVSGGGVATWNKAKETTNGNANITIMYGFADGTGGAITITWGAKSSLKDIMFCAFAGAKTTASVDVTGSTTGTGTTFSSGSTSSSTTNTDDVVIGTIAHRSAATFTAGPTNSFSNIATPQTAGAGVAGAQKIETATETPSTSWTVSTSSVVWAGAIAAFFPAATGPLVKTVNALAVASVKTVNGLAMASVKTINGLGNV